ncbi:hypothetical protein STENM36S_04284 [Streptomyces tendae]
MDAKTGSQFIRGGPRAGIGGLAGERPRGVRIRESAHSRRMRHIHGSALLARQNASPPQMHIGEANSLWVHAEFGS